jgi:uncharacterized protein YhbP (UPF0306 family)
MLTYEQVKNQICGWFTATNLLKNSCCIIGYGNRQPCASMLFSSCSGTDYPHHTVLEWPFPNYKEKPAMGTPENPVDQARKIIADNRYLTLATAVDNDPWSAGLAYAVDKDYNFFFYSAQKSKHATHIAKNPNVAFSIFNSTLPSAEVDGLQIAAIAEEVGGFELLHVVRFYFQQSFPAEAARAIFEQPIEAFKGAQVKRFYKLTPTHVYKLDLNIVEVDVRFEISLDELRKIPAK